jgi:hypothetical protein
MARKRQPRSRPPTVPPPAGAAARPRPAAGGAPRRFPVASPAPAATEELSETYSYVKRDLARIGILAVVLFGAIILSQYLPL